MDKKYYYLVVMWKWKDGKTGTAHFRAEWSKSVNWYDRMKSHIYDRYERRGYEVEHWDGHEVSYIEYATYVHFSELIE